jgi:hypothetical protein
MLHAFIPPAGALLVFVLLTQGTQQYRPQMTAVSSSRHLHAPIKIRERHGSQVTSENWSGYAVTGSTGSVTDAKGSWIVPMVQSCGSTASYSSFWVGIDGYSSNTVEQIGTDSDCVNGWPSYYAWFEFYPHLSYTVNSVPVKPGDVISAQVSSDANGRFTVTLTDITTGGSFSTSAKMPSAKRSSAEWITEAPSSGGITPLADFSVAYYGNQYTGVAHTCFTKVGSTTGAIGSFGSNVFEIQMVDNAGAPEATPSSLSGKGSSFSVAWQSSGQ